VGVPTRGKSEPADEAVCTCVSRFPVKNVRRSATIRLGLMWTRVVSFTCSDPRISSFEVEADSFLFTKPRVSVFRSSWWLVRRRRRDQMQNESRTITTTTQPPDAAPTIIPICDILELLEGDAAAVAEEADTVMVPPEEDDAGAAEPESDASD
jgi:hypothetical protein